MIIKFQLKSSLINMSPRKRYNLKPRYLKFNVKVTFRLFVDTASLKHIIVIPISLDP